jgi:acyl-CoA dehydrogenase
MNPLPFPGETRLPFSDEHVMLRETARRFFAEQCAPHREAWEQAGMAPREIWLRAGELGLLCPRLPVALGGSDGDFLFAVALIEEQAKAGLVAPMLSLHSDVVAPYVLHYGTPEQQARVLPKMASGEWIGAVAMSEPGAGSDLRAMRMRARPDGNGWLVSGQKIFISNGVCADLIVLAAQTDKGISLFLVETAGLAGFSRSAPLDKMGQWAGDTAELFFDEVRLPGDALLGGVEGQGFRQLVERLVEERLLVGIASVATMEAAIDHTLAYTRERRAFGRAILDFQNSRFKLAEARTDADVARVFLDSCIRKFVEGRLDASEAAMLKYWTTETLWRIIDDGLQLHGGYGYMLEFPIARMWLDNRVARISGGSNEIMKEIIGRSL